MEFLQNFLKENLKAIAVLGMVVLIIVVTSFVDPTFGSPSNLTRMAKWVGMYGVLAIGVSFVIMTGGIDLSIGSLIALTGVLFPIFYLDYGYSAIGAFGIVAAIAAGIGFFHGILITKLRLQPFLVTLCGLLMYRSLAQAITKNQSASLGASESSTALRQTFVKDNVLGDTVPMPFLIMVIAAAIAAIILGRMVVGRHMMALGRNEQAARFSGINTDIIKISCYVFCSLLAALGGIMFLMDGNSATPSTFGNFYELYAIAGAVLGGCSLRGGEGSIIGVICGTVLIQVTTDSVFFLGFQDYWKGFVIGLMILIGVIVDEFLHRAAARRQARQAAL